MKKAIVSTSQNIFYDGKQVDHTDLTLEQQFNEVRISSTINNTIGSGVISDYLEDKFIYKYENNSVTFSDPKTSDLAEGSQLSVSLKDSLAFGLRKVKVLIIGLNFESKLIYDAIELINNETIQTKQHYTSVLFVYTNDLQPADDLSMNLGGTLIIKEAPSISLSKDLVTDNNDNPSIFFRDLYIKSGLVADGSTLDQLLEAALPEYDISELNINTDFSSSQYLYRGDIVTQIAQKFIAQSNNIQKVSVLMSVENIESPLDLEWDGDLVVSIYPLQSSVSCITDIIPQNKIDYDPTASPLAQTSFSYATLLAKGIVLDNVPQPVDFIFSNTVTGGNSSIKVGEAYAIVFKRSGASENVNILFTSSSNTNDNRQLSIFNGNGWTNINNQALWYKVYSDSAKIASGQYYTYGQGVLVDKIKFDDLTGINIDYSFDQLDFGNNQVYKAVCQSKIAKTGIEENPRTGDNVYGQKLVSPSISLLSPSAFLTLQTSLDAEKNELLTVGAIQDTNKKYINTEEFNFPLNTYSVVDNKLFIKVITDNSDPNFDQAVIDLKSMVITNAIKSAKLSASSGESFRISDAKIHTIQVGNYTNSTINYDDLDQFKIFKGIDLTTLPSDNYLITVAGSVSYTPSYYFLTYPWVGSQSTVDFTLADGYNTTIATGLTVDVTNNNAFGDELLLTSASGNIETLITGFVDPYVYLHGSNADEYLGGKYLIVSASGNSAIIKKPVLSRDYTKAISFDIDQDMIITDTDLDLLKQFLDKAPYVSGTNPYLVINTEYEVLELSLEKFVDRHDDYVTNPATRSDLIHVKSDIWSNTNYKSLPTELTVVEQLDWQEYDVLVSTDPRNVMAEYTEGDIVTPDFNYNISPNLPSFEKNINNEYIPGNIILGESILNRDLSFHALDFETFDIILEIPQGLDGYEKQIDVFNIFVAEANHGLTYKGFAAKKFSDGTYVQSDALSNNQVKLSVSVQSFTPELDSAYLGYESITIDGRMGVAISDNGILTINFTNLYSDPAFATANTKLVVTVYLKKAGFANQTERVNATQLFNLLD